jgi:hypothetical protein
MPPDVFNRDRFWSALHRDVARYGSHLTTSIWIPFGTVVWSPIAHTTASGRTTALPGGGVPIAFDIPDGYPDAKPTFVVPAHHTLILGDAVVGREAGDPTGPGVRLPPDSTYIGADEASRARVRAWCDTTLRESFADAHARFMLAHILVTYGEPIAADASLSGLLGALDAGTPTGWCALARTAVPGFNEMRAFSTGR